MFYDLILPIGERCHTDGALREIFPVQLLIFNSLGGLSLPIVYEALRSDLRNFCLKENLFLEEEGDKATWYFADRTNNVRIRHLFGKDLSPEESLNHYYPVLERLKRSTITKIQRSRNILFVHATNLFSPTESEILDYSKRIRQIYTDKHCDFLYFTYDKDVRSYTTYYRSNGIRIYGIPIHPLAESETGLGNMDIFTNMPILKQAMTSYWVSRLLEKSETEPDA